MPLFSVIFAVVFAALFTTAAATRDDTSPLATLSCGQVKGIWISLPSGERVAQFRAIPYAVPPVGKLRWQAPSPAACWTGVYDATQYKDVCAQGLSGSEDCLYLTVTVPEGILNGSSLAKAPTMFYIHGGGLMGGSANYESVAALAAHTGKDAGGIVVVTVNYRLNI